MAKQKVTRKPKPKTTTKVDSVPLTATSAEPLPDFKKVGVHGVLVCPTCLGTLKQRGSIMYPSGRCNPACVVHGKSFRAPLILIEEL